MLDFLLPQYIIERKKAKYIAPVDDRPEIEKGLELVYRLLMICVTAAILLSIITFSLYM